jgi:hypothetical protein
MKRHLIALALASAVGASASAQLVHVTLDGIVTSKFEGGDWWKGPGSGEDQPARLQLFYDSELPAQAREPWSTTRTYQSNSAKNNFWRLQYGALDVSAPIHDIEISETGFTIYAFRESDFTTLDLKVAFAEPWPGFALPLPPFPALAAPDPELPWVTHPSSFVFDTAGPAGLDEGSIFVGIDYVRSEYVERFQAVPESSAYGLSAAAALGAAVAWRRRLPAGAMRPA